MTTYEVITNNPLVKEKFAQTCSLRYEELPTLELFQLVRDLIQKGHKLLTHPLAGSVKPNETPYRSIMISKERGAKVDPESELIMEECIIAAKKFPPKGIKWPQRVIEDFQYIDYTLISNVLSVHG